MQMMLAMLMEELLLVEFDHFLLAHVCRILNEESNRWQMPLNATHKCKH